MTNTFKVIDNVLGAAAEAYQNTVKQDQQLKQQQADFQYQQQQRALQQQGADYFKTLQGGSDGVTTGTRWGTMSEDPAQVAAYYGATPDQISTAQAKGAQGFNDLFSQLNQSGASPQQPPTAGLPAGGTPASSAGTPAAATSGPPAQAAPAAPTAPPMAQHVQLSPGDPGYDPTLPPPVAAPVPAGLPMAPGGDAYTNRVITKESGGNPNAKNPNSTAGGVGQFIDGTWERLMAKYRPDLVQGKTPQQVDAMKSDPQLSAQMIHYNAMDNAPVLQSAGVNVDQSTLGLAHALGPQGAVSVLQAAKRDPSTPASSVLSADAVAANPQLQKATVGQLVTGAQKHFGTGPVDLSPSGMPSAGGAPAPAAPATQGATVAPAAQGSRYEPLAAYMGNAYDTDAGPRITSDPLKRTPGQALEMYGQWQLAHGVMGPNGQPAGAQTLIDAANLRAKEQLNEDAQRKLDTEQLQKSILTNTAGSPAEWAQNVSQMINKSHAFPAHVNIVSHDGGQKFAWEAKDPQTGQVYTVEQGTKDQITAHLIRAAGSATEFANWVDTAQKMQSESRLQAAQAKQADATAGALTSNASVAAAKAPSETSANYATADESRSRAAFLQAQTAAANFQNRVNQEVADTNQALASTQDATQRAQLQQKLNGLKGMSQPTISSNPGPNGVPETQITYPGVIGPNGGPLITHFDSQGVEVPLGEDSRAWKDEIKGKPIQYGWHADLKTGQPALGFSTLPGALPNGAVSFSPDRREVLQALKIRPRANHGGLPASPSDVARAQSAAASLPPAGGGGGLPMGPQ
jgi:hypothetical protein